MAGNPNQKLKLLYIADYLRQHTDGEHPASTDDIMEYLMTKGISSERKSVYNDIDVLKEYGLDIKHLRSGPQRGYYTEGSGIEADELVMLINALRASPILSRGKTASLIKKLRNLVSDYQPDMAQALIGYGGSISDGFSERLGMTKSENEELYRSIDLINKAVDEGKKISFIYRRRKLVGNLPVFDGGREFVLSPYAVIRSSDHFYAVGNIDKYDDLAHYRVDRMKTVRVLDEPARPYSEIGGGGDKFDPAGYSRELFNMFSGGEEMTVQLMCRDSLLETMVERFGTNTQYRQLPNGFFTLKTRVRASDGFIFWLLGFGGDVIADEPSELVEMIRQRLAAMQNAYTDKRARRSAAQSDEPSE